MAKKNSKKKSRVKGALIESYTRRNYLEYNWKGLLTDDTKTLPVDCGCDRDSRSVEDPVEPAQLWLWSSTEFLVPNCGIFEKFTKEVASMKNIVLVHGALWPAPAG